MNKRKKEKKKKQPTQKGTGGVGGSSGRAPAWHETLSSTPVLPKKFTIL
jgi:hypothetical protein